MFVGSNIEINRMLPLSLCFCYMQFCTVPQESASSFGLMIRMRSVPIWRVAKPTASPASTLLHGWFTSSGHGDAEAGSGIGAEEEGQCQGSSPPSKPLV